MGTLSRAEAVLRKAFSDYDQTVDVVSCWHSLVEAGIGFREFHRFPKFSPGDLTPDFALTHQEMSGPIGREASHGSIICDVKRFPDPFKGEQADEGDFRPYERSLEQLRRYAADLRLVASTAPDLHFRQHDVVLFTKSNLVDTVYKFLSNCGIPKPFNIGRPLVLVEYAYDAADQQERYVFRWKQGEHNNPFSHPMLRKRMVERSQPMMVAPRVFIPSKLKHVVCNDSPPSIYVLVFLWLEIFPGLLDASQYAAMQDRPGRVTLSIRTGPAKIIEHIRARYRIPIKTAVIRDCFKLLEQMKRAYRVPGAQSEEYEIAFSTLIARPKAKDEDEFVDKRREGREYANIFASMIASAEEPAKVSPRKARVHSSAQISLF